MLWLRIHPPWTSVSQQYVVLQVGGFLSFNILFPSERPDIPRLMGWVPCSSCCFSHQQSSACAWAAHKGTCLHDWSLVPEGTWATCHASACRWSGSKLMCFLPESADGVCMSCTVCRYAPSDACQNELLKSAATAGCGQYGCSLSLHWEHESAMHRRRMLLICCSF